MICKYLIFISSLSLFTLQKSLSYLIFKIQGGLSLLSYIRYFSEVSCPPCIISICECEISVHDTIAVGNSSEPMKAERVFCRYKLSKLSQLGPNFRMLLSTGLLLMLWLIDFEPNKSYLRLMLRRLMALPAKLVVE